MRRTAVKVVVLGMVVAFYCLCLPTSAPAGKKNLSAAEDAGIKLLAMQQKGFVELVLVEPSPLLYIEALAWKNLTHQEKVKMGRLALDFVGGLNREQGNKYLFVFIKDMTTKDKLGTVYLKERRVEINK